MAAQTLTGKFYARIDINETLASGLSNTSSLPGTLTASYDLVSGNTNTALAIDQEFCKGATTVTLNASASVTYTLTALTDDIGRSKSFANGVRGLSIYVTSRTAGDFLTIGAAATNTWTGLISINTATVKVFDFFATAVASTDKYAVSAGNDQFKITNGGSNPITFKLATWGNT
jgi:hypothetical protein